MALLRCDLSSPWFAQFLATGRSASRLPVLPPGGIHRNQAQGESEFLGCVVRGVSRRDRGTEGRSCLDVGVDALTHVVIASFPPLSFSTFDHPSVPSAARQRSHPRPVVQKKKEKTDKRCAWIRRPSKIDSSRKLGANGVARAWACQWRRCVDRFSRASRACMNSRGGKSIGLRPVRPYRRMCRIVRRTTEGDSIWSSSSFDERDRISKQFAEENEERIEEGRRIVRALSIAERVVTFRGGARRRGKGRSNYKTFDREQETDQGRNNRRGYESK